MNIDQFLQFQGTWRTYQARILERADSYLADGKIHIVAAPGSGKTTLGIELIRRMGERALVLVPTITIREQWIARIEGAFLRDGAESGQYLSQSLRNPRAITVVTYQALHCAMTQRADRAEQETDDTDDMPQTSAAHMELADDYTGFQLIETMKEAGIGTLCLDECHHLRNEWWKSLETFQKQMGSLKTIALTATPPYDSTPAMWTRYMNMCGEIDEEITIPELVKEGSLCPHQDYVYFNYPTKAEEKEIQKFAKRSSAMFETLMQDTELCRAVQTHKGLHGQVTDDTLLETPSYLAALLIYLQAKNISVPVRLKKLLGAKKLPDMNIKWMEQLLQGFLYDDTDAYICEKTYREQLLETLKSQGLIEKKKVTLTKNAAIEKTVTTSAGKCESIKEITFHEYQAMGAKLRLLILTDYIRKEYENHLGNTTGGVQLGVLPFFELLRRENEARKTSLRLGVLCGTVVIIPAEAKQALLQELGTADRVTFTNAGDLPMTEYLKVKAVGDTHILTAAVTAIFEKGYIQALIGTKSLLGEGWDSPCVNTLILASFVGSYMLSNQMRGRAIRVCRENPEKTSNIWHLVCLKPWSEQQTQQGRDCISEDFSMLERRMENFLGLHDTENTIESGIDRLSIIQPPFDKRNTERINREMLKRSAQRNTLQERWNRALAVYSQMEIADETIVKKERLTGVVFWDALVAMALSGIAAIGIAAVTIGIGHANIHVPIGVCYGLILGCFSFMISRFPKIFMLGSPLKRLQAFGNGIRKALSRQGLLEDEHSRVVVEVLSATGHAVYLKGGSGRDKALFAQCVSEFFDVIDNQRYLLVKTKGRKGKNGFYAVPDCFAKNKEDAERFAACMKPYIGAYTPVYTRSEQGRKVLLEARVKALANRETRCISGKRKVKGALE